MLSTGTLHSGLPLPESGWNTPSRLFWLLVSLLTLFGVFVLPMAFPTAMPTRSTSYVIGFNNRVAAIDLILISFFVAVYLYWKNLGARVSPLGEPEKIPLRWLGIVSLFPILCTTILGRLAAQSQVDVDDIGYWQTLILQWSHYHGKIYRDFEFVYGPILFYWPAYVEKALGHLGIGPWPSVMVALLALQLVGIAILFYLLQQLPLSRNLKIIAFIATAIGPPLLGMNYTMFRFATAYAALFWVTKQPRLPTQALFSGLGALFLMCISADAGMVFSAGIVAYALYRGLFDERRWLAVIPAPIAGLALFTLLVNKNYFYTPSNFSKGLYTHIVEPSPYIDALLIVAAVLAPLAIAGYVRRYGRSAGPIFGMYIAALAMLVSALGCSIPRHVFTSGLGLCLISLIGLNEYRGKWARAGLAVVLLLPLWCVADSALSFPFSQTAHKIGPNDFDLPRLLAVTAGGKVYMPIAKPPDFVSDALLADGQFQPSYFAHLTNSETPEGEQRKIAEMEQATFVLMPEFDLDELTWYPENRRRFRIFRLGYTYKPIHPYFRPGAMIQADLNRNYVPIEEFRAVGEDKFMLYRKK